MTVPGHWIVSLGHYVGGLDVVSLLAAIAGCHCIAGLPLLNGIGVAGCCWVPLLDAIGGDRLDGVPLLGAMVRCDGKMPWWVSLFGAIAACWPLLGAMW